MPRTPRKFVFEPAEVGVYHCVNRCVRRAFLCGTDAQTGKCYEHRKGALQQRLKLLAGQFAVDVLGFAIMSNHIHLVARNRPDIVADWSDEEVARRWWNIFPKRKNEDGTPAVPTDFELQMITAVTDRLAEIRRRLSSISWFMRCLVEPIARLANREDACSGRFWNGRSYYLHLLCLTNWKLWTGIRLLCNYRQPGSRLIAVPVYRHSMPRTSLRSQAVAAL